MKQNQREILTKEKQARMATGGGPPPPETNIDPDVAIIAPNLLETAPVLFTSNMTENEISEMEEHTLNILPDSNWTTILCENSDDCDDPNNINKVREDEVTSEDTTKDKENQNINISNKEGFLKRKSSVDTIHTRNKKMTKVEKNTIDTSFDNESTVKIERLKQIIEQEKEMAEIRKAHEKRMAAMKEDFQQEIHILEIRAATAKATIAELQLQKEKEKLRL